MLAMVYTSNATEIMLYDARFVSFFQKVGLDMLPSTVFTLKLDGKTKGRLTIFAYVPDDMFLLLSY